jgi:hypothetical protein
VDEQTARAREFFKRQGFLPVDKNSYFVFKAYEQYSELQEMGATIIAAWSFAYNGLYKLIHGYLCSVFFYEGKPVYFSVHPPQDPEYSLGCIVDILYGLSREAGLPHLQIKFIEDRYLKQYMELGEYKIKVHYQDDDNDYAYRVKDLLELSGNSNYYKRKRLKKFLGKPNVFLHPITKENISLCFKIEEEWCRHQDCAYCESFSGCEKKAMEIMADIFDERFYTGLFGFYDDLPAGYVICEKINKKLAFLYFGKSVIQDFFVYLIYMMFKEHLPDVEYMNMNEDMGNLGLRQFKKHLSPHELWRNNICTFTQEEEDVR